MKKVIIIGATSGIGYELTKVLVNNNYQVGVTGRRTDCLKKMKEELNVFIKAMDISQVEQSMTSLNELISEMGGLDILVISAGVGYTNSDLIWDLEKQTIDVNCLGFAAMANVGVQFFNKQGHGHLVGISSIAALIGGKDAPAYSATKAFVSNYLKGLRLTFKSSINITDIQPGYVDTKMAQSDKLFWVVPKDKAAKQIYQAIKKRKKHVYISKRWRLIAWLIKIFM